MNIRHLEYLRSIIALGSFKEAAQTAGVSQPAITQAMYALQRELGISVFYRQGKRNIPTPEAIKLAQAGEDLQRTLDNLRHNAGASTRHSETLILRVGMAPAAGLLYSPTIHDLLKTQLPECTLRLDTGHAPGLLARLLQDDLDIVIAPLPRNLHNERLNHHVMYTSEPLVYCRSGHPAAKANALLEIAGEAWVVAGAPGTPGSAIEEAFRVRHLPAPRVVAHCSDYSMLIHLLAHSDLLGVVSHHALLPQPEVLGLTALSLIEGLPHYSVCLFWTSDLQEKVVSAAKNRVIEALVKTT